MGVVKTKPEQSLNKAHLGSDPPPHTEKQADILGGPRVQSCHGVPACWRGALALYIVFEVSIDFILFHLAWFRPPIPSLLCFPHQENKNKRCLINLDNNNAPFSYFNSRIFFTLMFILGKV